MSVRMTTGSTGSSFPRWQLAILLGTPIAIGLGYLYLKNRHEDANKNKLAEVASKKTISLDNDEPSKPESPLERATKLKVAGNRAFHVGKYDEAITLYNEAIEACPQDHPADLATYYQNRSACYEKREMWENVKQDCTQALLLNEKYVRAFLRRSRAAEKSHDLVLALEDVTAACILEGFQVQSSLVMADRVLKALGKQHAQEALSTKEPMMPSKHFVKTYFSSFSQDPVINGFASKDKKDYGIFKAKSDFENQRFDSIVASCTEEIESADSNPEYRYGALLLRATFYLLLGQHDEALKDFGEVISDDNAPGKFKVNALIKRASLHMQVDNKDQCQVDFELASSLDPDNCDVHHHHGQAYLLTGKVFEASEEFTKAIDLNPDFAVACIQKCYAQYTIVRFMKQTDKLPSVFESFESAIKKFNKCPEAYILYAEVLSDQNNFEGADELFEKAIEIDPQNANILVHRGILHLKKSGDVEKAVKMITTAISIDEKCLFAYETLGTIEVQRENLKKAVTLFEKAITLTKTELEMTHLFALRDAAFAQLKVSERWGLNLSTITP